MKPFLLFALLLSNIKPVSAQIWSIGAKWVYGQEDFIPDQTDEYIVFTKEKDTLVQGHPCSYLSERYIGFDDGTLSFNWLQAHHIFWQDGPRVLFFNTDSMQFLPLYDFSKNPGDTLSTFCSYVGEIKIRVDSVASIDIGGQPHKIQWVSPIGFVSCTTYGPIYEYVGWQPYLFARPGFVDPPPGGWLLCFSDSTLTFPEGSECNFLVDNKEIRAQESIKIFPNPTRGRVFIQADNIGSVRVFDLFGKLRLSRNGDGELNLETLPDGIYLLNVERPNGTFSKKIVKKG